MSTNPQAQSDPIAPATFTAHALSAMQMAEDYIRLGDKAEFAQQVLMREVAESKMTDEEKELCKAIAETGILKDFFGLIVDGTKGKLSINKVKKRARNYCLRLPKLCIKQEKEDDGSKEKPFEMEEAGETPVPVEPTSDAEDSTEEIAFVNEDAVREDAAGSVSSSSQV